VGAVALAIIGSKLHLPARPPTGRVDLAGAGLITVFTSAVLLTTAWGGQRYGWGTRQIVGLAVVAVIALLLYVVVERRAAEPMTPLSLFRTSIFSISSALFFLSTLVLFVAMLYVPLFLEEVRHDTAFASGLFLIPLLVGLIVATAISGGVISRTGRYKFFPIVGALLAGGGMYALSWQTGVSATWLFPILLAVVGVGLGFFVQVAVLAGQNAVEPALLGVATGVLNFFKTMGGAFGAALFGAILAARLSATAHTTADLTSAFHAVFIWTVPFMVVALVLAVLMKEKPLSDQMREVAAGNVEVPEY
jgi:Na+/melibiose symporter-like transporter